MARKVKDDDRELYEVAVLLLTAAKATRKWTHGPWRTMDALIRRAEAALKART
jgi:hypothetical protein